MADFCKACSIEMFGEDSHDLAIGPPPPSGKGYAVICEGCGYILVNELGECIACDLKKGQPGHGQ